MNRREPPIPDAIFYRCNRPQRLRPERLPASLPLRHCLPAAAAVQVCHGILERSDFTEANAHDISGLTVRPTSSLRERSRVWMSSRWDS